MNEDAPLVERVLQGDKGAYGLLIGRHKAWLYRFIRRHVINPDDAEDVLQDSFASAWRGLSRYDAERPFEIWLRRIALNKCRDLGRKHKVRRAVFVLTHPFSDVEEQAPQLVAAADTVLIADESTRRLQTAIAALPVALREALVLTALEGLSQKDAAQVLGTNAKTVENRVARARAKLAAALDVSQVQDMSEVRRENGG